MLLQNRRSKYTVFVIIAVLSGIYLYFKYNATLTKHYRLATYGVRVPIAVNFTSSWGVDYSHYYFITKTGYKIEKTEKCGKDFSRYLNAVSIYNPNDPNEFELSFMFDNYSEAWIRVFYGLICFPALCFISYNFIRFGVIIFSRLRAS